MAQGLSALHEVSGRERQGIMDKNAVKEIMKEYKGREYAFPIGVKATNVETDNSHQFVTKTEKTKIGEIDGIRQAFTDGCNVLVSACTTYGTTPESNSPSHIADAIRDIYNKRYSDGYNAGHSAGRLQGQKDVVADPGAYGIDVGYTIEQMKVDISTRDWSEYDAFSKCFTAPNDGVLVVGNTVHAGIGVIWGAEGTHEISVTYKGNVVLEKTVEVYGGPDGYAQNNPYPIITNQQYPLKAGEQLTVKAKFTGRWLTDEDGSHGSGTICSFGGDSSLTWVHIYSDG